MENLSTFVRTLGNQFIRGRKIFVGAIGLDGEVLDGNTSAGTSGQVLSTTGSGVQWITVGSSNVGELDDLTDVQTGTPSDGQLLRYDSESGLWYNWTPNYLDTADGLNDLNGVVITSPVANQFLKYNGSNWVNANVLLSTLGDTSISSPSVDQILVYGQPLGGTPGVNVWYNKTHSFLTTATNIDDLNNVVISEQASGDILRYNGTNWVNVTFSSLENDTLDSVTDRGNTTTNAITVGGVNTDYVEFDTSVNLGGDESQGYMAWNSGVDTVSVYPYDSTWFNIGQDMHWHVKNGTAHTIERGQVVMATGAVGNSGKIEVGLMVADGTVSSKYILGVAIRDIASGEFGKVSSQGIIRGVDTSAYQDGTLLWADPDTDGGFTSTEPDAPNLRLPIAFVVSAANNGAIAVRITTGNVLHELHDVDAPSPATGDLLRYSALTGIWENWTPTYISSFTETDPIFVASPAYGISSTNITNWNTAYGWGNHATAGYLTSLPNHNHDDRYYTETEVNTLLAGKAAVSHTHEIEDITGLADSLDLKLESESDTLDSVTGRGNTTSNTIFVGSARGSSGTYGTGIYGDNSGASVQFGTAASVDSLGIVGAYSSQFNINSKNGPLSFQYYGTEYMNISAAGALKLNTYGAGLLKTDASGNVTVDTNVYITADDQELTWTQETKELSISDGNTVTLDGLASIADVEGYGYITTEVDTLNTVTTRGATTTNSIGTGNLTINSSSSAASYIYLLSSTTGESELRMGDTDTDAGSIAYNNNLDRMAFRTNAAERVYIDSSGNVGIGASSPASKLQVNVGTDQNVAINSTGGVARISAYDDAVANSVPLIINGSDLRFHNNTSEAVRITGGNVGIGTTSPEAKLDVVGSFRADTFASIKGVDTGNPAPSANELRVSGYGIIGNRGGLYFTNSDTGGNIQFGIGGVHAAATKMYITSTGNVGIGTTSPGHTLTVDGGATNQVARFISNDPNTVISIEDSDNIAFFGTVNNLAYFGLTNGQSANNLNINSSGNVGIGTTSPLSALHVNAENAESVLTISRGGTDLSANTAIGTVEFKADYQGSPISYGSIDMYANSTSGVRSSLDFNVKSTSGNIETGLTVQGNSGTPRVGIGTTSPAYKLDVAGDIYISNGESLYLGNAASRISSNSSSDILYFPNRDHVFGSVISGADVERVRITESGNVGIGTTSPSTLLHIAGNNNSTSNNVVLRFEDTDGNTSANQPLGQIQFYGNDASNAGAGIKVGIKAFSLDNAGNSYLTFSTSDTTSNDQERLRIDKDGNVGIGTTSPTEKLDVNGRIIADAYLGRGTTSTADTGTGFASYDVLDSLTGPGLYQVTIVANPNSAGSGSYADYLYGKVIVGTGWSGSAVTDYIHYVQENPDPRNIYPSGGGNLTVEAFFNVNDVESSSIAAGTAYSIRIKISGYSVAGAGTVVRIQKIG